MSEIRRSQYKQAKRAVASCNMNVNSIGEIFRMKTVLQWVIVFSLIMVISHSGFAAQNQNKFSVAPTTNNGEKWRIGYYQGGNSIDYYNSLITLVQGLMKLGWIKQAAVPEPQGKATKPFWNWLVQHAKSDYITFVGDAHYSADWNGELRQLRRAEIVDRLNNEKDLDFMIVMGTWAGQDLATNDISVPMTIMQSSDPISSRVIKSAEDSGYDHVHAHLDQRRYERQIRLFHDLVGFKSLGVSYEDTVAGRSYAAIDFVNKVAAERGFEVIPCFTQSDIPDPEVADESVIKCFQQLVEEVDAIYVTKQQGVNLNTIPTLVQISNHHNVPTFSQSGSVEVKHGVLMSMESTRMTSVGYFHAEVMAQVFNGAKPRQLVQVFEARPNITINLKTAEIIGFIPHADVLAGADEIYLEIEKAK